MAKQINASIITIGDELLIGQTIDTNSAWLGTELNKKGVWIRKRVAVGDVRFDIEQALRLELQESDIVIITGGLGPTADDITKPLLCDFFGGTLINNAEVEAHVRAFFEKRKRPMLDVNILQAMVPDNCEVLWNQYGTAPGMLFRQDQKLIFSLPGVPLEMKEIMSSSGFAKIENAFTMPSVQHATLCTAGKGESFIAVMLRDFEKDLPSNIKLAYLPALGQVKLRLTGINVSEYTIAQYKTNLQKIVGHICFADKDISLQQAIFDELQNRNLTIALAESCTGGYISHLFTDISGASKILTANFVTYTNEAKNQILGISNELILQHTATSEEVAIEMAKSAMSISKANIGLATSGLLEKDDKQDSFVWIAITDGARVSAIRQLLPYAREKNKELAASFALTLLWQYLHKEVQ
jgi:nicotinamide-nucleotide amidase